MLIWKVPDCSLRTSLALGLVNQFLITSCTPMTVADHNDCGFSLDRKKALDVVAISCSLECYVVLVSEVHCWNGFRMIYLEQQLSYCPGCLAALRLLEEVQPKRTKMTSGFRDLSCSDCFSTLECYSVKDCLLGGDLIMAYKVLHGLSPDLHHLFVRNVDAGKRGDSYRLAIPRWDTEVMARFFFIRVLPAWNQLPEHVIAAVSVVALKR